MAVFTYRRHVLAMALYGAMAAPAAATEYPFGVLVGKGESLVLHEGDTISLRGSATGRAITVAERGSFDAKRISVVNATSGNVAGGAYGLLGLDGSETRLVDSRVTMEGRVAYGVQTAGGARAMLQQTDVILAGADNTGVMARADSLVALNVARVKVNGNDSRGLVAAGEGAAIVGRVDIDHGGGASTRGSAYGVMLADGGSVSLSDSRIVTRAEGVAAVSIQGAASTFSASRSTIVSEGSEAAAIEGQSGTVLLAHTTLRGADILRTATVGGGQLEVEASENARLLGDTHVGAASLRLRMNDSIMTGDVHSDGTGSLAIHLINSRWTGSASANGSGARDLHLDRSTWLMTGPGEMSSLTLTGGSRIAFAPGHAAFGELRTGSWRVGDDTGVVRLRTRLDAGGSLTQQATDRLLIAGDVAGRTLIEVVHAGGAGAATAAGPEGGISVVQVGGTADASSFRLAGRYVVAGPWQYRLAAYAPGQASAGQRRVAGEGSGFWDFRLQNAETSEHGIVQAPSSLAPPSPGAGGAADGRPASGEAWPLRHALAPQVPSYLVLAGALFSAGQTSMDAAMAPGSNGATEAQAPSVSASLLSSQGAYRSSLPFSRYGFDATRRLSGLQLAGHLVTFESAAMRMRSGVVATTSRLNVAPRAVDGVSHATSQSQGVALTYAVLANAGWRVDWAYGFTRHRLAVEASGRGDVLPRLRANANDASLAGSWHWAPTKRLSIDPGVALLWQRLRFTRAMDRDGIALQLGAPERTTMRAGARATLAMDAVAGASAGWATYADARYVAARDAGAAVRLSGVRFDTGRGGRAVELTMGGALPWKHGLTLTGEIGGRMRLGGAGEAGRTARLGVSMVL